MDNVVTLFQTIRDTVTSNDSDLKTSTGRGTYFAPELFVAFCIGRDISLDRAELGMH